MLGHSIMPNFYLAKSCTFKNERKESFIYDNVRM
jgi:hypothetical protein